MGQCPRCRKFTLVERSDILPTPPGTKWAPLPRKWVECSNCGYDSRQLTKGELSDAIKGVVVIIVVAIATLLGCWLSDVGNRAFGENAWVIGLVATAIMFGVFFLIDRLKK